MAAACPTIKNFEARNDQWRTRLMNREKMWGAQAEEKNVPFARTIIAR
jgi:hypothetical protein